MTIHCDQSILELPMVGQRLVVFLSQVRRSFSIVVQQVLKEELRIQQPIYGLMLLFMHQMFPQISHPLKPPRIETEQLHLKYLEHMEQVITFLCLSNLKE